MKTRHDRWNGIAGATLAVLLGACSQGSRERAEPNGNLTPSECGEGYEQRDGGCVESACAGEPCVFGTCRAETSGVVCACQPGYAGARCDRCAPGYRPDGLACVPIESCDIDPCVYGVCRESQGVPTCDCWRGYAGSVCDACAPGFEAVDLACVSATPCDPDPCAYGACRDVQGAAVCDCEPGYAGARCDECADGFRVEGQRCVAEVGNPCAANPCTEPHRSICVVTGQAATCLCEPGFRDTGAGCEPSDSCDTLVRYVPRAGESIGELYLRGELNGWALTHPLARQSDGSFTATLQLDAGDYAYKLFDASSSRWFEDSSNPYFKWVDGTRNSRLRVRDCDQPRWLLETQPTAANGSITFTARFIDGAQQAGLDVASIQVTRNDQPVTASIDGTARTVTLNDGGLSNGKHTYRLRARDNAGRATELLYVPVWLEDEPFRWDDAILYFVLTDRFADGDPSNNAPVPDVDTRANWQGGDFAGLLAKIESGYFDELGVNALWLSSIVKNTQGAGYGGNGDDHFYAGYHSYWPASTGWRAGHELAGTELVEPHFGSLDDFKAVVQAAHRRGIRVLVDLVANHVHTDSPLWQQYASAAARWFHDLYVCGWEQPIACWFADYLPDFDYRNLEVLDAVVEHAVWLVQETDLDGFRLDAVKHMIHDFPLALRARLRESVETTGIPFYMVGETFVGEGEGEAATIRQWVNANELDGQFDFPLYWQIVGAFLREERTFAHVKGMMSAFDGYYGANAVMSNFLGNHDVPRAISHAAGVIGDLWGNGSKHQGWTNPPAAPTTLEPHQRLRLAWTFLMTIPGVPLIYYGDELGLEGAGDPDNRRFMRFGDQLNALQRETLAHVQKLTSTRRAHPALRRGRRVDLQIDDDGLVWGYGLVSGEDRAVVVLNRKSSAQTRRIEVGQLGLGGGATLRDALGGQTITVSGGAVEVTVPAREAALLVSE